MHRFTVSLLYPDPALDATAGGASADRNTSTYWRKDFSFVLDQPNASSSANSSGAAMGNGSQAGALAGGIAVDVQGEVVGYQVCLCVRAGVWGGKGAGRSGGRQCELGGRVPCPQMLAHGVAIAPHCR